MEKLIITDFDDLTWQRSGSEEELRYEDAKKYIENLNEEKFGSYTNWRLPTLKEAETLVKIKEKFDSESGNKFDDQIFPRRS